MAVRTVSVLGGNWNATTAWVGGVVPIVGDTVDFTSLSGNLTVNVTTATLAGINFTNYIGIITFNANIVLNTSVNLGSGGYTQAGAFGLLINNTTTIISNGTVWSRILTFSTNTSTITLSDNLYVTDNILLTSAASYTLNGNSLFVGSNLTMSANGLVGTSTIVFNGTGTWNHTNTSAIRNNINIDTPGILTLGSNIYYNTGTLTYTSGTVVTTGNKLIIALTTTLNTSGMTWNNVTLTSAVTITLTSILVVEGTLSIGASSFATSACHVKGNLTITGNTGTAGTIIINGTGNQIWSGSPRVRTNLQINKPSGTLTISGSVAFTNSTLTYIAGNVDTTGSTLTIDVASTIDTNDLFWNNISLSGGTQTLLSDINCQNLTSAGNIINGLFNVNVGGNLTANGVVQGTSTIVINGTGTWTALNGSNTFRIPIIINTNGIITLANTLYQGCSLTYIKGTVKSNNTTITFGVDLATTLINLHKLIFKNVLLGASKTITMNEFFSGSPSLVTNVNPTSGSNYTIAFQDGFEKISKFVNISGCTLLNPLQLLVITKSKINSTNRGIRYINQSPNGIAKGVPSINAPMTFGVAGLLSDPNMK